MKRWPLNEAYFWETAPFFRLLLPFAAGILCYKEGWVHVAGSFSLTVAAVALFLFVVVTYLRPGLRVASFITVSVLLLAMGNACASYNDVCNDSNWLCHKPAAGSCLVRISGIPAMRPTANDYLWRIPVDVLGYAGAKDIEPAAGKAIIYVYNEQGMHQYAKGDSIFVPAGWERITNAGNPFEFDYAAYCAQNGLYHRQFIAADDVQLYAPYNSARAPMTDRVHEWCNARFDKYITNVKARGLIQAMMLGDEVNLDRDMRDAYADTGIVHIIAISGGNVAIFFIVISFLLRWLHGKRYLWLKYAIALPLVWFYVMMAGASPSAIRAAVMFSLFSFAIMFQKNNNSVNGVFATAMLLLCAQPMWLFSLGFQLSFMAVLSLILFYRHVHRWWMPVSWPARKLWPVVAASIAAQVLVAPLIIYYFHSFPPMFLVANVLAYLFMGLVLILSIAVIAVSMIPALATALGVVLVWLVDIFGKIVSGLQYLSPASFRTLLLTGLELLLVYIVIAGISVFLMHRRKPALFLALGTMCVLFCSFCVGRWQRLTQERLVVYNIAHENYVELIRGNTYNPLTARNTYNSKGDYAIKPVHINLQSQLRDTAKSAGACVIGSQKVLVLDKPMSGGYFPADVVVINYLGNVNVQQLKQVCAPKTVVIGSNYSQKQQRQIIKQFDTTGIRLHAVARDGAFVLER